VTPAETERAKEFIFAAERVGLKRAADQARDSPVIEASLQNLVDAHVSGFAAAFYVSAALALVGAVVMFALVRRPGRTYARSAHPPGP
jgi:hypothetical protein